MKRELLNIKWTLKLDQRGRVLAVIFLSLTGIYVYMKIENRSRVAEQMRELSKNESKSYEEIRKAIFARPPVNAEQQEIREKMTTKLLNQDKKPK